MSTRSYPADAHIAHSETSPSQRSSLAVALVPVLVLVALTMVVGDLIAADTGLFGVVAAIAWLVFEMYSYQRLIAHDDEALPALSAPAPLAD